MLWPCDALRNVLGTVVRQAGGGHVQEGNSAVARREGLSVTVVQSAPMARSRVPPPAVAWLAWALCAISATLGILGLIYGAWNDTALDRLLLAGDDADERDGAGEQEPFELLALHPAGSAEPRCQPGQAGQPKQRYEQQQHIQDLGRPPSQRSLSGLVDQGGAPQGPQQGASSPGYSRVTRADSHATGRQRRDGRWSSGNSNNTKVTSSAPPGDQVH